MQTLSTFVSACNNNVLLEATFGYCLVYVLVAMCSRKTRTWWVGGRINSGSAELEGGATVSLWRVSVRVSYDRALHCASKLYDRCTGS
ncbi:hypothetical protein IQ06DRAFT_290435 [Phaeosphaeriaceae sp. SRC1lsM3a]|nr:hypothetical protein IQ06DRAFT_290435 [Stagonospora sp. SRC1lsM3a]